MTQKLCVIIGSVHYRFTLKCTFDSENIFLLSQCKKIWMLSLSQEQWYCSIPTVNPSWFWVAPWTGLYYCCPVPSFPRMSRNLPTAHSLCKCGLQLSALAPIKLEGPIYMASEIRYSYWHKQSCKTLLYCRQPLQHLYHVLLTCLSQKILLMSVLSHVSSFMPKACISQLLIAAGIWKGWEGSLSDVSYICLSPPCICTMRNQLCHRWTPLES